MASRSFAALAALLVARLASPAEAACGNPSGLLAMVVSMAPECLDACEEVCGPLADAIDVFSSGGGEDGIKALVCQNQAEFGCLVSPANLPKCSDVLSQAAGMGFNVPRTAAALRASCSAFVGHRDVDPNATTTTMAATTVDPNATTTMAATTTTAPGVISRGVQARAGASAAVAIASALAAAFARRA